MTCRWRTFFGELLGKTRRCHRIAPHAGGWKQGSEDVYVQICHVEEAAQAELVVVRTASFVGLVEGLKDLVLLHAFDELLAAPVHRSGVGKAQMPVGPWSDRERPTCHRRSRIPARCLSIFAVRTSRSASERGCRRDEASPSRIVRAAPRWNGAMRDTTCGRYSPLPPRGRGDP